MQTDPWAGLGAPRTPLSSLKQDESFPRRLTFPELLEGEGKGSGWGVCCGEGRGGEGTGRKGYLTWSPQCPICLTKGDLGSSRPPPPRLLCPRGTGMLLAQSSQHSCPPAFGPGCARAGLFDEDWAWDSVQKCRWEAVAWVTHLSWGKESGCQVSEKDFPEVSGL